MSWVERSKSFRVAHISKRSKLDSARGGMDKTMAKEIRRLTELEECLRLAAKVLRAAIEDEPGPMSMKAGYRIEGVLKILERALRKSWKCDCAAFVSKADLPQKVIVLKCSNCGTEYVLFPNGKIEYTVTSNSICIDSGSHGVGK
jgi:hypothetical protein